MAVLKRRFYFHEKGNHDEKWLYLARDTETGEVYIIHEWAERDDTGEKRVELAAFFNSGQHSAQQELLKLIGELVTEATQTR